MNVAQDELLGCRSRHWNNSRKGRLKEPDHTLTLAFLLPNVLPHDIYHLPC